MCQNVSIVRLNKSLLCYYCHLVEDTPRRMIRERNSLLTSTPDKRESAEMEKRSSSTRTVKQQSRQLQDDFNDDNNMETGDQSIHSKSLLLNNNSSMFDDKPKHLYGK